MFNFDAQDKNIDRNRQIRWYLMLVAGQLFMAVLVVVAYAFFTQGSVSIGFDNQTGISKTGEQTTASNAGNMKAAFAPDTFSAQTKEQVVAPLAVIEQISGNEIVVKVALPDQSGISKISASDSSKEISLNTTTKTFNVVIDSNTKFIGLSQGDLKIGGGYTIVVDKPFYGATGKLMVLSISLSNMSPDQLSKPLILAPPTLLRK